MFITKPNLYEKNVQDAKLLHAGAAQLNSRGASEPAVGLFYDAHMKFVLPVKDALRVANQIADAVEEAERENTP